MKRVLYILLGAFASVTCGCGVSLPKAQGTDETSAVYPDYRDVTIPPNIAPLNFSLAGFSGEAVLSINGNGGQVAVKARKGHFDIPMKEWGKLLEGSKGSDLSVTLYIRRQNGWERENPFTISVAEEEVDPYIAYRLIDPGYELWNHMGIYQRNIETFEQRAIYENRMTESNCINCHSFADRDPERMLFHMRDKFAGTIFIDGKDIESLNTYTDETDSHLVYPSWHPSGDYVAFSVNGTRQGWHASDRNRIEVFDLWSDVVVYDLRKHLIITTGLLFSKDAFETFPTFSPDGRKLYFCSAPAVDIPSEFESAQYSLMAIDFDPETGIFGSRLDTLYNASALGGSVSFPRVSPEGRYLMLTLSNYGNFSIWHHEADLYTVDLSDEAIARAEGFNSGETESYHSWSSNGRWVVFSSRRDDGLYTRPYIGYFDRQGVARKPFMLPQKEKDYYTFLMKSYNIPEFVTGSVTASQVSIANAARKENKPGVSFEIR